MGLCSYLLIGFYFDKKSAGDAGKKAFIVNRIGDAGFLLGMMLIFVHFGSLRFEEVFAKAAALPVQDGHGFLFWAPLCLFVGATGKSAQIPLFVWLPDAMEGPTPGIGPDPCGHDGDGRRLHGLPLATRCTAARRRR